MKLSYLKPGDEKVSAELLASWGIKPGQPELFSLEKILAGFAGLPFENLSKIIRSEKNRGRGIACFPENLLKSHFETGSGGTCLSLVYLLKSMLDLLGISSYFILADRHYGENTHSALLVKMGEELYLADPGYLIFKPVKLNLEKEIRLELGFSDFVFTPKERGKKIEVSTLNPQGIKNERYLLKNIPVLEKDYLDIWQASYQWEMMNHLVINKLLGEKHFYLKDLYCQQSFKGKKAQQKLAPDEMLSLAELLGISPQLVKEARAVLGGKLIGKSTKS